jgi:hypothetical protein
MPDHKKKPTTDKCLKKILISMQWFDSVINDDDWTKADVQTETLTVCCFEGSKLPNWQLLENNRKMVTYGDTQIADMAGKFWV